MLLLVFPPVSSYNQKVSFNRKNKRLNNHQKVNSGVKIFVLAFDGQVVVRDDGAEEDTSDAFSEHEEKVMSADR